MSTETTNLITGAQLLAETLESQYGLDPAELFDSVGLDYTRLAVPDARYPRRRVVRLWRAAVERTGDECLGLAVGRRIRATTFHAIGLSWLASPTLREALNRLIRYYRVLSTEPIHLVLHDTDTGTSVLQAVETTTSTPGDQSTLDAFALGIVQLARLVAGSGFDPLAVELAHDDHGQAAQYVDAFRAPVLFNATRNALIFDREHLDRPLPGNNPGLASANDVVAERYLASLDPKRITTEVRELLIDMLPSGEVSQASVARRLHRSLSTLQRQLQSEGTNFQEIRDQTRQSLAREYIRARELSLSQVAYLLGFSDQSNFSRAFRRWTGVSPKEYRG